MDGDGPVRSLSFPSGRSESQSKHTSIAISTVLAE
jgi:hypothetical protein